MSDVTLLGVLRMPIPNAPDPLTLHQFIDRARQAADRIEADTERIAALEAALAKRERPTVAIGAKASEWKTLSPQAQALIQQAAQKAVARWSEQQKLDGAARAATPLVPLGASDLDRAHGGIDNRIAALEAERAEMASDLIRGNSAMRETERVIEHLNAKIAVQGAALEGRDKALKAAVEALESWERAQEHAAKYGHLIDARDSIVDAWVAADDKRDAALRAIEEVRTGSPT